MGSDDDGGFFMRLIYSRGLRIAGLLLVVMLVSGCSSIGCAGGGGAGDVSGGCAGSVRF